MPPPYARIDLSSCAASIQLEPDPSWASVMWVPRADPSMRWLGEGALGPHTTTIWPGVGSMDLVHMATADRAPHKIYGEHYGSNDMVLGAEPGLWAWS